MVDARAESFVFVVNDKADVRQKLAESVSADGWRVETYSSAVDFLATHDAARPGCVLLVLHRPDLEGMIALKEITQQGPPRPVIVLLTEPDFELAVESFRAGAIDLFLLPPHVDSLIQCIRAAVTRDLTQRRHYLQWQEVSARLARLTPPELEVVKLLTEGMLNKQIAARLNVAVRTIELRRANIFRKMEVTSLGDLLRLVIFLELYPHGPQGD